MPVEMATSKMIAATIEKERDADDDQYRDEALRSAAGLREQASNPRAFKRTARREGKRKKWAAAKIREDFRPRAGVKPVQAQGSNSWLCKYPHNHEYDSWEIMCTME